MNNSIYIRHFFFHFSTDPFQGGETTVGQFITRSREVCADANTDQPFMCVDLTFIAVLLEEGYGLKPKTPLKVSAVSIKNLSKSNRFSLGKFLFISVVQENWRTRDLVGTGLCVQHSDQQQKFPTVV